jgi:formylglycine-generating enzyme required for sulfatase activity
MKQFSLLRHVLNIIVTSWLLLSCIPTIKENTTSQEIKKNMIFIKGGNLDITKSDIIRNDLLIDKQGEIQIKDYFIGKYNITIREWRSFLSDKKMNDWIWGKSIYGENLNSDPDFSPIGGITWYEAILFCNWLSEKSGLEKAYEIVPKKGISRGVPTIIWHRSNNGYRLPTFEEWEFAVFQRMEKKSDVVNQIHTEENAITKSNGINDSLGRNRSKVFSTRDVFQNSLGMMISISQIWLEPVWAFGKNEDGTTIRSTKINQQPNTESTPDFSSECVLYCYENKVASYFVDQYTFFTTLRIARNARN